MVSSDMEALLRCASWKSVMLAKAVSKASFTSGSSCSREKQNRIRLRRRRRCKGAKGGARRDRGKGDGRQELDRAFDIYPVELEGVPAPFYVSRIAFDRHVGLSSAPRPAPLLRRCSPPQRLIAMRSYVVDDGPYL